MGLSFWNTIGWFEFDGVWSFVFILLIPSQTIDGALVSSMFGFLFYINIIYTPFVVWMLFLK